MSKSTHFQSYHKKSADFCTNFRKFSVDSFSSLNNIKPFLLYIITLFFHLLYPFYYRLDESYTGYEETVESPPAYDDDNGGKVITLPEHKKSLQRNGKVLVLTFDGFSLVLVLVLFFCLVQHESSLDQF